MFLAVKDLVDSFKTEISKALDSVDEIHELIDSVTSITDFLGDPDSTQVIGATTIGQLENYR